VRQIPAKKKYIGNKFELNESRNKSATLKAYKKPKTKKKAAWPTDLYFESDAIS
jgi:hypothetical protein